MTFLKTIKTAKLLIKLSNKKVIRIEELKNGNYAIIFEGIDINKINFSKLKELWECFNGLVKTDAGPKPDPRLISYVGLGSPKRKKNEKTKLISADFVKGYLDGCITKWRNELGISKTKEDKLIAECNIDTFQSVRISLLGELLPKELKKRKE